MGELVKRLHRKKKKTSGGRAGPQSEGWIGLKRENRTFLAGTRLGIFDAALFPAQPHFQPGQRLQLGVDQVLGPWTVSCTRLRQTLRAAAALSRASLRLTPG